MKVALGQFPLEWENPKANLQAWTERFAEIPSDVRLVILPEMFTTGFSLNMDYLDEPIPGPTANWMLEQSAKHSFTIMGSFPFDDGKGRRYNRLFVAQPNGETAHYDKRHLFTFAKEDEFFNHGSERLTVDIDMVSICPLICYDLRFPVWSRNSENSEFGMYDVLIYVANWPEKRIKAWNDLLIARAHENQSYVIGVNRVGTDGNGISYSGNSVVIGPRGEILAEAPPNQEGWILHELEFDIEGFYAFRDNFPALNDADNFEITD